MPRDKIEPGHDCPYCGMYVCSDEDIAEEEKATLLGKQAVQAELDRLTAAAKMVEQEQVLAKLGYRIEFGYDTSLKGNPFYFYTIKPPKERWITERAKHPRFAFQLAVELLLSSLPDPQRSELAKKLGVE